MDKWLKIYLVVCAAIIVLLLAVIIVDLIVSLKKKGNEPAQPVIQKEPVVVEKVVEKIVETPAAPVTPVEEKEEGEGKVLVDIEDLGVKFSKKLPLREKYKQMQPDARDRFDRVEHYLSNVEDIKIIENNRFLEFKFGHTRIARLTIKKDIPHCECFIVSPEFTETVKENKVSVKAAGPIVKIKTDADVDAVRQIVDANVGIYKEMKHPKKKVAAK